MKRIYLYMLLAAMMTSCGNKTAQQDESASEEPEAEANAPIQLSQEQIQTIGVKIGPVSHRQMTGTLQATGTLQLSPQHRAEVTSLVQGIARRILVKEGDVVRAGQPVAMVENTEMVALQKDYLIAARQLSLAKAAYDRQDAMHAQGAGVEKNVQQAKADLDIATVTEQGLRQQLQQLGFNTDQIAQGHFQNAAPIRAPISGVVGEIQISTGSYLDSETVLMPIFDNKALHADLNVFESDIANIHIGQKVDMQLSDQAATQLTGHVSFITSYMNQESKAASVHVDLDKTEATLMPNMYVSAVIHGEDQTCQAVPDGAIVTTAGRSYVFVSLGKNQFRQTEVVTGFTQQGYTQITFILPQSADVQVVTAKAFYLQSMIADHGEEE